MGAPAAGEIGLGDDRDLGAWQRASTVERGDHDRPAPGRSRLADGEVEVVVEQDLAQPAGRPDAVGSDGDRVPLRDQIDETSGETAASVTADRAPPRRLDHGGVGCFRRGVDGPEHAPRSRAVRRVRRAAAGTLCRVRATWTASARARSSSSASSSVDRSRIRRGSISTTLAVSGSWSVRSRSSSTSHGTHDSIPSKWVPSASRSHCSGPTARRRAMRPARVPRRSA